MQNRCDGCRHWDAASADWGGSGGYAVTPPKENWGSCEFILHVEKDEHRTESGDYAPIAKSERAALADGSGYWAGLNTRADFGCAEWEAKPV